MNIWKKLTRLLLRNLSIIMENELYEPYQKSYEEYMGTLIKTLEK